MPATSSDILQPHYFAHQLVAALAWRWGFPNMGSRSQLTNIDHPLRRLSSNEHFVLMLSRLMLWYLLTAALSSFTDASIAVSNEVSLMEALTVPPIRALAFRLAQLCQLLQVPGYSKQASSHVRLSSRFISRARSFSPT